MVDVVVAGHICLDIIPRFTTDAGHSVTDYLAPGRLSEVGPVALSTGGAVSNTGLNLKRLGVDTRLMGKVGDDLFGRAILDVVGGFGPELAEGMSIIPGETSSYTVVINPPHVDRIFLHCPGANHTFGAVDVRYDLLSQAKVFHLGYPPLLGRMYADGGAEMTELKLDKKSIPPILQLKNAVANKLVFSKIQDALGGRLRFCISGAAPLNAEIAKFFHGAGVLILEGIGMTENTSFSHVTRFDNYKFGSVGQLGPEIEHRIAEDGELLTRGPNTMLGYYKNPEATAETIDAEGWLHTGDIGEIEEEGFLRITDRKKDLIITAGGKNVAPAHVEQVLRQSHYIGQAMAVGDRKKFLSAVVTLDPETMPEWAEQNDLGDLSLEELAAHPRVHELIELEIERCNKNLASYESIKRFEIVPKDFSIEGGELTPTMKIKRKVVVDKYKNEIEALYED